MIYKGYIGFSLGTEQQESYNRITGVLQQNTTEYNNSFTQKETDIWSDVVLEMFGRLLVDPISGYLQRSSTYSEARRYTDNS